MIPDSVSTSRFAFTEGDCERVRLRDFSSTLEILWCFGGTDRVLVFLLYSFEASSLVAESFVGDRAVTVSLGTNVVESALGFSSQAGETDFLRRKSTSAGVRSFIGDDLCSGFTLRDIKMCS